MFLPESIVGACRQLSLFLFVCGFSGFALGQTSVRYASDDEAVRLIQTINHAYGQITQYGLQHLQMAVHQPGQAPTRESLHQLLRVLEDSNRRSQQLNATSAAGKRLLQAWQTWLEAYDFAFRHNLSGLAQPSQLDIEAMEQYLRTYQGVTAKLEKACDQFLTERRAYIRALDLQLIEEDNGLALAQLRSLNAYQITVFLSVYRVEATHEELLNAFERRDPNAMQAHRADLRILLARETNRLQSLDAFNDSDNYRLRSLEYFTFLSELNSNGYPALLRHLAATQSVSTDDYNAVIKKLNEELPDQRRACQAARENFLRANLPVPELLSRI